MKRTRLYFSGLILTFGLFALSTIVFVQGAKAVDGTTVTGKVLFEGTAPAPQPIKMDADPVCLLQHKDGATSEEVVVNSNGTPKNVFVYVKQGLEGQKFEAPRRP